MLLLQLMLIDDYIIIREMFEELKVDEKSEFEDVWEVIKDKSVCQSLSQSKAQAMFK